MYIYIKTIKKVSLILVAAFVLVVLTGYQIALAVKGEGSATIDGGGNATVERAISHTFTVLLTVGASGITVDAANPTFTLPAGFTAPSASPVATAGDVVSDGQWSAIGGATCPVTMGSSGASGQVMTVDVTTVCTVGPGGTITLTYKGTSASTMGATALTIMTADDAGVPTPAIALTGGSPTITVTDTVVPTVTVTMDDAVLNVGDTSLVTFTFSEAPTGFTTADVTVANGSIGAIDTTNPLIQTATYTPTNDITDATNVITVGTAWTDAASNTGVGDDSPNYTIDTTAPTVTVTMSDATLTVGETALVTFTFSEAPTGFTTADVTVANGSIGAIDTSNPLVQTATYTPTNDITDATNVITVGTVWTDAASNTGVGDDSPNYTIDTTTTAPAALAVNNGSGAPAYRVLPLIGILKVPSPLALPGGSGLVTYNYTVWNVGGWQALTAITVADDTCTPVLLISGDLNSNSKIDPGEKWKYSCTATLSTTTTNIAIATGYSDDLYHEAAIDTAVATVVVGVPVAPPLINVIKVPSRLIPFPFGGGEVTYTYTVTNPGVVAMHDVVVTDDKCGPVSSPSGEINGDNLLDPDETWTYTCQTDLTTTTTNIVIVSGEANGLTARDFAIATVVVSVPGLTDTGPRFPNTGLPPEGESMLWDIFVLVSMLIVVSIAGGCFPPAPRILPALKLRQAGRRAGKNAHDVV